VAMDADEDVDRRCVNCGGSCHNYDIVGSDDHAYARRMCGRCSLQYQQWQQDEDDDDDDEEGKVERRMCDNCGAICNYLRDGVDHACYTRRLCATEMLSELQASFAGRQFRGRAASDLSGELVFCCPRCRHRHYYYYYYYYYYLIV